jgi:OPT family oligopeptide transporter
MPNNLFVTNLFGGSMANEGLGILSLSFDWQFIGGGQNPMWMPYRTLVNEVVSYLISIGIYMGLYYGNVWQSLKFPFLSPMLFSEKSTAKRFIPYNTTAILNKKMEVQDSLLEKYGLPYKTSASIFATTGLNAAISATFIHMFIWHYQDLKSAWSFFTIANFKKLGKPKEWNLKFWTWKNKVITQEEANAIDPHYGLMMAYDDIPQWWFGVILVLSMSSGLVACYLGETTLPWWGFFVAISLSAMCLTFFAAQTAMFGFSPQVQPLIQLIGAYLIPGKPVANMYFATYGFNSLYQAKFLLRDLKLGQYTHLAPRCTFATQMVGTAMGCIIAYFMMEQVVEQKQDILRDIQGTNVWSGQQLQGFNSAVSHANFVLIISSAKPLSIQPRFLGCPYNQSFLFSSVLISPHSQTGTNYHL